MRASLLMRATGKGLPVPDSLHTDQKKKDISFISYLVPLPSKNSLLHSERGARLAAGYYSVRERLQSSLMLNRRETPKSARSAGACTYPRP